MLIRSQDKEILVNMETSIVFHISGVIGKKYPIFTSNGYTIGFYSTKAKALKVLDMIQEAYTNEKVVEMVACNFRDVPSEVKGISDAIIKKMLLNSAAFQVPEDSEVEV